MSLRLGDIAPDFTAQTTQGEISFHHWLGNSWGVLFSHPADYTPVCTTELGRTAKLKPEFDKRGVKVIAVSVDGLIWPFEFIKIFFPSSVDNSRFFQITSHLLVFIWGIK